MDGARELKEPSPEGALCSSALVILLINSMLCKYLSWLFKLFFTPVYLNSYRTTLIKTCLDMMLLTCQNT